MGDSVLGSKMYWNLVGLGSTTFFGIGHEYTEWREGNMFISELDGADVLAWSTHLVKD